MRLSKRFISKAPVLLALCAALTFGGCTNPAAPVPDDPGTTPAVVSKLELTELGIAPVKGGTAVATIDETDQYTGTIAWKQGDTDFTGAFAASTEYKAVLTLTANEGFTFNGVAPDSFEYAGASVTNAAGNGNKITVTITFPPTPPISIGEVGSYLDDAPGGTVADPIPLPVQIDLATEWSGLLNTIQTKGKYVALDLSTCTMSGGEFDPNNSNPTGKGYIASLILPDAATSIKEQKDSKTSTFKSFTELNSVSGKNVLTVGLAAFNDCDKLATVSFPVATSIGGYAFLDCNSLTTVNLPKAVSIGNGIFGYCDKLATVNLPVATSIGEYAFAFCNSLTTVNLPKAASIGDGIFGYCDKLATVNLPVATSIGYATFLDCNSLTTVNLPATPPTLGDTILLEVSDRTIAVQVPSIQA